MSPNKDNQKDEYGPLERVGKLFTGPAATSKEAEEFNRSITPDSDIVNHIGGAMKTYKNAAKSVITAGRETVGETVGLAAGAAMYPVEAAGYAWQNLTTTAGIPGGVIASKVANGRNKIRSTLTGKRDMEPGATVA